MVLIGRQPAPLNAPLRGERGAVTGGARILPGATPLATFAGQSLAAGASFTAYAGPVSGHSYMLTLDTLNANGATSANPFTKVSFIWKDGPGGNTLDIQHWFILQTNVSPAKDNALVGGRGPIVSGFLVVLVKNMDPANAVTTDFKLLQSSRVVTRHDLRSISNNISGSYSGVAQLPSFSTPTSDPPGLIGGMTNPTIPPVIPVNGSVNRINALFAGQAQLCLTLTSAAALNVDAALIPVAPDFTSGLGNSWEQTITAAAGTKVITVPFVTLPRMPTVLSLFNNGTTTVVVDNYMLTLQEFAS
jgi:hypothetical protein